LYDPEGAVKSEKIEEIIEKEKIQDSFIKTKG
jgi:hypothetical protein